MKHLVCCIALATVSLCDALFADDLSYSPLVHELEISESHATHIADQKDTIVLHFGDDVSRARISAITDRIYEIGYRIEAHPGGPAGLTVVYIDSIVIPKGLTAGELNTHLDELAEQLGDTTRRRFEN